MLQTLGCVFVTASHVFDGTDGYAMLHGMVSNGHVMCMLCACSWRNVVPGIHVLVMFSQWCVSSTKNVKHVFEGVVHQIACHVFHGVLCGVLCQVSGVEFDRAGVAAHAKNLANKVKGGLEVICLYLELFIHSNTTTNIL